MICIATQKRQKLAMGKLTCTRKAVFLGMTAVTCPGNGDLSDMRGRQLQAPAMGGGVIMVRPGYKQTEVGEIPEDWEVVELVHLTSEVGDGIHATPVYSNSGKYYFVNGNNLVNGQIVVTEDTKRAGSSEFRKHKKKLNDRSILLSINGTIGNLALYAGEPIILGKSAAYLNVNEDTSKQYVYFSLQTESVRRIFQDGLTGTTIKNLGLGTIREAPIAIPKSAGEQQAIAEALGDVDGLLAGLSKLIAKKRAIKTATMQQLLTGKTRLPGFGEDQGYKQTEVGEIPEDWSATPLGDILEFKNGLNKAKEFFGEGTPIVNYMDVFNFPGLHSRDMKGKVTLSADEIRTYQAQRGDVFFTRTSETVDEIGLASVLLDNIQDAVFSGFVLRGRSKKDKIDILFKKYCFRDTEVRKQICSTSSYTTRALTNGKLLSKVYLAIPPTKAEQQGIATVLSDMDSEIEALKISLHKTKAIKQGMMQELLTGRTRLV